ncbi:MAG: hypothetical protein AAF702_14195 [Chloroflexota bacterium]
MAGIHISMNAWNEFLARSIESFEPQHNVSPEWLINPGTKRRLKLDRYYPDAGIAIRFAGLTAKGQKRQSDWEVLEEQQRDQIREELCKMHNVFLAVIDPIGDPVKQADKVISSLRRAKRSIEGQKKNIARKIERSMLKASELRSLILRNPEQMMASLAEGWRDRETNIVTELQSAAASNGTQSKKKGRKLNLKKLKPGDQVIHERFGPGKFVSVSGEGDDAMLAITFDNLEAEPQTKTFMASLVADKLRSS